MCKCTMERESDEKTRSMRCVSIWANDTSYLTVLPSFKQQHLDTFLGKTGCLRPSLTWRKTKLKKPPSSEFSAARKTARNCSTFRLRDNDPATKNSRNKSRWVSTLGGRSKYCKIFFAAQETSRRNWSLYFSQSIYKCVLSHILFLYIFIWRDIFEIREICVFCQTHNEESPPPGVLPFKKFSRSIDQVRGDNGGDIVWNILRVNLAPRSL